MTYQPIDILIYWPIKIFNMLWRKLEKIVMSISNLGEKMALENKKKKKKIQIPFLSSTALAVLEKS